MRVLKVFGFGQSLHLWTINIFFLLVFNNKIDTEGCNSTEKTKKDDSKIFALSILMSNLYIFNTVGNIDDRAI